MSISCSIAMLMVFFIATPQASADQEACSKADAYFNQFDHQLKDDGSGALFFGDQAQKFAKTYSKDQKSFSLKDSNDFLDQSSKSDDSFGLAIDKLIAVDKLIPVDAKNMALQGMHLAIGNTANEMQTFRIFARGHQTKALLCEMDGTIKQIQCQADALLPIYFDHVQDQDLERYGKLKTFLEMELPILKEKVQKTLGCSKAAEEKPKKASVVPYGYDCPNC